MRLDADLGIDSIKRVEILSALQEQLPDAPVIKPEHLGVLQTLGQIVEFLTEGGVEAGAASSTPHPGPQGGRENEPGAREDGVRRFRFSGSSLTRTLRSTRSRPRASWSGCGPEVRSGSAARGMATVWPWPWRSRSARRDMRPGCSAVRRSGVSHPRRGLTGCCCWLLPRALMTPRSRRPSASSTWPVRGYGGRVERGQPYSRPSRGWTGRSVCAASASIPQPSRFRVGWPGWPRPRDTSGPRSPARRSTSNPPSPAATWTVRPKPSSTRCSTAARSETGLGARRPIDSRSWSPRHSSTRTANQGVAASRRSSRGDVVVISGGARGITAEVAVALAETLRPTIVLLGRSRKTGSRARTGSPRSTIAGRARHQARAGGEGHRERQRPRDTAVDR